mmetsp:Transcript_17978/g.45690  ORF Transcript_17978/g.45690 Transcript_17978/m.45690 type:complete len:200 (-) Transcript_17978:30-629(-)
MAVLELDFPQVVHCRFDQERSWAEVHDLAVADGRGQKRPFVVKRCVVLAPYLGANREQVLKVLKHLDSLCLILGYVDVVVEQLKRLLTARFPAAIRFIVVFIVIVLVVFVHVVILLFAWPRLARKIQAAGQVFLVLVVDCLVIVVLRRGQEGVFVVVDAAGSTTVRLARVAHDSAGPLGVAATNGGPLPFPTGGSARAS